VLRFGIAEHLAKHETIAEQPNKKKGPAIARKPLNLLGAGSGTRTHTLLRAADFESLRDSLINQGLRPDFRFAIWVVLQRVTL